MDAILAGASLLNLGEHTDGMMVELTPSYRHWHDAGESVPQDIGLGFVQRSKAWRTSMTMAPLPHAAPGGMVA